jgi:hypothetical protein
MPHLAHRYPEQIVEEMLDPEPYHMLGILIYNPCVPVPCMLKYLVYFQGPELEEQKLLILRKEIEIHCLRNVGFSFLNLVLS